MANKAALGALIAGILAVLGGIFGFITSSPKIMALGAVLLVLTTTAIVLGHLSEDGETLGLVGAGLGWLTVLLLIIQALI